ncbi:MAG: serine/threonine protein kinase [Rhodanobacteraceae bacterium]|nr:serine/threonine protein kinase [Rhodanobacteraceae bacterium]
MTDYLRRKQLYLELLDLEVSARTQRLAQIELEDVAMAVELRAQFAAAEHALPLLDRIAHEVALPALAQYTLLHELGRGGMGRVWLAERRLGDAVQQVALKQIVHSRWDEDDRRRFERERRILAGLEHPHIAALVDGGSDASGAPYLATVFVDGERLDRYVVQHTLPLTARVRLIVQISAAVAYAHRRLVVHRDLKPANILVDHEGAPKLLDFGVARLLGEDPITATGTSQMTLRYAAPEQVRGDNVEVGISGDIYALGVLLYELITDVSPYGDTREPSALIAAILQQDPPPPSSCARLPGADRDLDAIVGKALRKRADERYSSADAFAADLQHWLAREPVEARRGENGYRARVFFRRRWPWLVAATLLLATAIAFLGYAQRRTQQQLAAVSAERDKARAVAQYFDELFASATPSEVREGKLTARELLQRSVQRLAEGDTANMPDDARAAMYAAAAKVMGRQQLHGEAATMYERAIALWKKERSIPLDDLTSALNDRANIDYLRGNYAAAKDWQGQALALRDSVGDKDSASRGHLLQMMAIYQGISGEPAAAEQSLTEAASILRAQLPESRRYYCTVLGNLASFALLDGRAAEGLAYAQEGLAQLAQLKPERVHTVLSTQRIEASALRELDRYDEAEAGYRRVIERARREIGETDINVAEGEFALAQLLMLQQRWGEAEAALREAEAIQTQMGGEKHPRALVARSDRSRILIAQEKWQEAINLLETVEMLRKDSSESQRSVVAGEQMQLAYARCRVTPGNVQVDALRKALEALRQDPPLPRRRLAQAEQWFADCARQAAAPDTRKSREP